MITIEVARDTQRILLNLIPQLNMRTGPFGNSIRNIANATLKKLIMDTHVDTGAYKSSHFMFPGVQQADKLEILLAVRDVRNPVHNKSTQYYGVIEEARGGSHATYLRTFEGFTVPLAESMLESGKLVRGLDIVSTSSSYSS